MIDSGMQPWPSADNDLVQTHSAVTVQDHDAAFAFRFYLIDGDHAVVERDDQRKADMIDIKSVNGFATDRRYNVVFAFDPILIDPYSIAVGPYIRTTDDVRQLQSMDVKSVIDLQEDKEKHYLAFNMDAIKSELAQAGIIYSQICMGDFGAETN